MVFNADKPCDNVNAYTSMTVYQNKRKTFSQWVSIFESTKYPTDYRYIFHLLNRLETTKSFVSWIHEIAH